MSRYRIGLASRNHVRRVFEVGFCQLGHGKGAAAKRLSRGDRIIYYLAREQMRRDAFSVGSVSRQTAG